VCCCLRDPILATLTQYRSVTDRQADTHTDTRRWHIPSIASRGKKRQSIYLILEPTRQGAALVCRFHRGMQCIFKLTQHGKNLCGQRIGCGERYEGGQTLLGPFYGAISVPSVTRCRCCRCCGHRFHIAIHQVSLLSHAACAISWKWCRP